MTMAFSTGYASAQPDHNHSHGERVPVANNIYPQVEIIEPSRITEAYRKVADGEVRFRYVIDMSKLK